MAKDWLINSVPMIKPSIESTTCASRDDTSHDVQDSEIDTTTKKPISKRSPVVLPFIKGVSEQIKRVFKQYVYLQVHGHLTPVTGKTEG